jgi:hypothetical protein
MSPNIYVGLALTAHTNLTTSTSTFDHLQILPGVSQTTHLDVSTGVDVVDPGTPVNILVQALDPFNNLVPGYLGTVHFTSSDPSAMLPSDYMFTTADNGQHMFTVILETPGRQIITVTDTAYALISGSTAVTVTGGASPSGDQPMPAFHTSAYSAEQAFATANHKVSTSQSSWGTSALQTITAGNGTTATSAAQPGFPIFQTLAATLGAIAPVIDAPTFADGLIHHRVNDGVADRPAAIGGTGLTGSDMEAAATLTVPDGLVDPSATIDWDDKTDGITLLTWNPRVGSLERAPRLSTRVL